VFARGEPTGIINVPPQLHAEFAKFAIDTPLVAAARAMMNFNQALAEALFKSVRLGTGGLVWRSRS
jgi:hypothetical protein